LMSGWRLLQSGFQIDVVECHRRKSEVVRDVLVQWSQYQLHTE